MFAPLARKSHTWIHEQVRFKRKKKTHIFSYGSNFPSFNEFLHKPKYIRYNILENKIYNNW